MGQVHPGPSWRPPSCRWTAVAHVFPPGEAISTHVPLSPYYRLGTPTSQLACSFAGVSNVRTALDVKGAMSVYPFSAVASSRPCVPTPRRRMKFWSILVLQKSARRLFLLEYTKYVKLSSGFPCIFCTLYDVLSSNPLNRCILLPRSVLRDSFVDLVFPKEESSFSVRTSVLLMNVGAPACGEIRRHQLTILYDIVTNICTYARYECAALPPPAAVWWSEWPSAYLLQKYKTPREG